MILKKIKRIFAIVGTVISVINFPTNAYAKESIDAARIMTIQTSISGYEKQLSAQDRKIYSSIYTAIVNYEDVVNFDIATDLKGIQKIFDSVIYDHPELFWVEMRYSYVGSNNNISGVKLNYLFPKENIPVMQIAFDVKINDIIKSAAKFKTNEAKAKYYHDLFLDSTTYTKDDLQSGTYNAKISQSAYSALFTDESVCAGWSKAFKILCDRSGIECYIARQDSTAVSGIGHVWNVYYTKDGYRNIDITQDNSIKETNRYWVFSKKDVDSPVFRGELSDWIPECV